MGTRCTLTEVDQLCFDCPLPDCDESDPRCPRQQALGNMRARIQQEILHYLSSERYLTASDLARQAGLELPDVVSSLVYLRRRGLVRSVRGKHKGGNCYWGLRQ
jgi:predicted Rossmann fold nucleotide-binding protein DprA/Smf involved in DNA uptake